MKERRWKIGRERLYHRCAVEDCILSGLSICFFRDTQGNILTRKPEWSRIRAVRYRFTCEDADACMAEFCFGRRDTILFVFYFEYLLSILRAFYSNGGSLQVRLIIPNECIVLKCMKLRKEHNDDISYSPGASNLYR